MKEMEKDLQDEIEDAPTVEETANDTDTEDIDEETYIEDDADESSEDDDEFEYDDDGNIVIPEDVEDDEEAESDVDEPEEEKGEEDTPEAPPAAEESQLVEDTEKEDLKKKVAAYERQIKDTLKHYGYEGDDLTRGLAQIAADSSGKDVDEYLAETEKAFKEQEAANASYEQTAKADLEALKSEYPELASYKSLTEMPPDVFVRFANLRGKGLTAVEAYAAANPKGIRENAAEAAKKIVKADNKAHLKSNVPKGKNPTGDTIPPSVLKDWMDNLFPNLTKEQVINIYKQTK